MKCPANGLLDRLNIVGEMQCREESLFEASAERDSCLANCDGIAIDLPDMRSGDNK